MGMQYLDNIYRNSSPNVYRSARVTSSLQLTHRFAPLRNSGYFSGRREEIGVRSVAIVTSAICGFVLLISPNQFRPVLADTRGSTLSGYVRDASTHRAIPGAIVTVVGAVRWVTQTGASGFYKVTVPSGSYEVSASQSGYVTRSVTARLMKQAVQLSFSLQADVQPGVLHVDVNHPAASDTNPGTISLPIKTITKASVIAVGNNARGFATTVLIHPGTYREAIELSATTPTPITFRATEAGTVVISGSDVWTGWAPQGNLFVHPWPYRWGLAAIPPYWPPVPDIVRRREMIFVNGALLQQVQSRAAMREGTFYIDEAGHRAYLWPPAGTSMARAVIEVAVRPNLLTATAGNLTIQGLVFQHGATFLDGDAVVLGGPNLLVEASQFLWNNWGGLRITDSTSAVIRGSTANHNGGRGIETYQNKDLVVTDNETSYNNWRGASGKFYDWAMGGIKNIRVHGGTFQRHRAMANQAWGFWFDWDNQNATVADSIACNNLLAGFDVEASQGPITISGAVACGNQADGVLISASAHVTLKNSVLFGNAQNQQFEVNPYQDSRSVDNWETGQVMNVRAEYLTLCGNAMVGLDKTQFMLAVPDWPFFLTTLSSSGGDFWNRQSAQVFWVAGPGGGTAYDLAGWRRVSGQDGTSVWANPGFTDPAHGNFAPTSASPWRQC